MNIKAKFQLFALGFFTLFASCTESVTEEGVNDSDLTPLSKIESPADYTFNTATANTITYEGEKITITGTGVTVTDNVATINAAGDYIIKGNGSNAQLIVKALKTDVVKLGFQNLTLAYSKSSTVFVDRSYKTIIHLLSGESSISDGTAYTQVDAGQNAAIYSQSYLAFCGSGTLKVTSNYLDGIGGKDGVVIQGATLNITSKDEGIRGKDYLVSRNADINITSGGDGLKSDFETDNDFGYILLENSKLLVNSTGDAITAFTNVTLKNLTSDITSGGGSTKTKSGTVSSKGIKAGNLITIENGTYYINSADDAIHSNKTLSVSGGNFKISSSDDGMHADVAVTLTNTEVSVSKCEEGIESKTLTLNNNTVYILSADDALNASAGSRTEANDGSHIFINGGTYILSGENGDPLDSNGNITMNGRKIIIHGPARAPEVPIDYNGTFKIEKGFLIASGLDGRMTQTPSTSSSVNSVKIAFRSAKSANSLVTILDENDQFITAFKPSRSYTALILTSDKLIAGKTYKVLTSGNVEGTNVYGFYENGSNLTNSTLSGTFSVSGSVSSVTVN